MSACLSMSNPGESVEGMAPSVHHGSVSLTVHSWPLRLFRRIEAPFVRLPQWQSKERVAITLRGVELYTNSALCAYLEHAGPTDERFTSLLYAISVPLAVEGAELCASGTPRGTSGCPANLPSPKNSSIWPMLTLCAILHAVDILGAGGRAELRSDRVPGGDPGRPANWPRREPRDLDAGGDRWRFSHGEVQGRQGGLCRVLQGECPCLITW